MLAAADDDEMGEQGSVVRTAFRVLFFRAGRDELGHLGRRHLVFGLVATWIVGMGRYWDDPNAVLLQHLGMGSLIYVFVLTALLWNFVRPIEPSVSYQRLLTFVTLTSPPAILYAFPVERVFDLATARTLNLWFLGIVATWRVALLVFFLLRFARLHWASVIVVTLLPLSIVVTALTVLNLEHAVFNIMAGLRETEGTANDAAYVVLVVLTFLSTWLFVPLLFAWGVIFFLRVRRRKV